MVPGASVYKKVYGYLLARAMLGHATAPRSFLLSVVLPTTLLSLCSLCLVQAQDPNDCLINEKLGFSDPANVYICKKPLKCCFEWNKPSCCGSKPSFQIIQEQITLWGGLFAILLAIASIVYCRKNDLNIAACAALKHCLTRFCCGASAEDTEQQAITLKVTADQSQTGQDGRTRHGWRNNSVNPIGDVHVISQV